LVAVFDGVVFEKSVWENLLKWVENGGYNRY
jgi:hypothetical protein